MYQEQYNPNKALDNMQWWMDNKTEYNKEGEYIAIPFFMLTGPNSKLLLEAAKQRFGDKLHACVGLRKIKDISNRIERSREVMERSGPRLSIKLINVSDYHSKFIQQSYPIVNEPQYILPYLIQEIKDCCKEYQEKDDNGFYKEVVVVTFKYSKEIYRNITYMEHIMEEVCKVQSNVFFRFNGEQAINQVAMDSISDKAMLTYVLVNNNQLAQGNLTKWSDFINNGIVEPNNSEDRYKDLRLCINIETEDYFSKEDLYKLVELLVRQDDFGYINTVKLESLLTLETSCGTLATLKFDLSYSHNEWYRFDIYLVDGCDDEYIVHEVNTIEEAFSRYVDEDLEELHHKARKNLINRNN